MEAAVGAPLVSCCSIIHLQQAAGKGFGPKCCPEEPGGRKASVRDNGAVVGRWQQTLELFAMNWESLAAEPAVREEAQRGDCAELRMVSCQRQGRN